MKTGDEIGGIDLVIVLSCDASSEPQFFYQSYFDKVMNLYVETVENFLQFIHWE